MNLSSPLTPSSIGAIIGGDMTSEIVSQATQFLELISPDLDENQIEYLSWRVCGFGKSEALVYSHLEPRHLVEWSDNPQFALLEEQALKDLQGKFADEVMALQQRKNTRLVSGIDSNIMQKAFLLGISGLTPQEFDYVKHIRNQFNPDVRRLLGDKEGEGRVDIPASFDEMAILLRRSNGNVNNQAESPPIQENIIEAEYRESPALAEGPEVGASEEDVT